MNNNTVKQSLVDSVLEQIKLDIEKGDLTSIEELIKSAPQESLESFLPESN